MQERLYKVNEEDNLKGLYCFKRVMKSARQISVIIPVYGHFDLARTILSAKSALTQKGVDLEVIISEQGETLEKFPNAVCLDIGPADFVDTKLFRPTGSEKNYEGIQVSHWSDFKRPELYTKACGILSHRSFLKLGHLVDGGISKEFEVRRKNLKLAKECGARIDTPYSDATDNSRFPNSKEEMNNYINRAKVGILTTAVEGINRFKMECLSADVPVLVPEDTSYPTKKHINNETGGFFEPTPEALAEKVEKVLARPEAYNPRAYILRTTGRPIAVKKLRYALEEVCKKDSHNYVFDSVNWDGRNQSLIWGGKVFDTLRKYCL